jgi:threonine aldolase
MFFSITHDAPSRARDILFAQSINVTRLRRSARGRQINAKQIRSCTPLNRGNSEENLRSAHRLPAYVPVADCAARKTRVANREMNPGAERHEFASDNTASICPEAWNALEKAKGGTVSSYGEDRWTAQLCERMREIFETDCEVFLVFNGTAANALALAQLCQPFHSIICHEHAHIETDECGAPEFFSGSKLLVARGANGSPQPRKLSGVAGKIDIAEVEAAIARQPQLHAPRPRVISIAQSTELGTVYTSEEVRAFSEFARERSLFIHMDGARFANAVASLGCRPKEITWEAGVDVLCFGGTKNGLAAGELVVFFRKESAREFDYRVKQAGQLASKMRFLAAPWLGLLTDGVWLRNAQHANRAARQLAEQLRSKAKIDIVFPVDANAVFVRMTEQLVNHLHRRGWHFYKFMEPDIYRVMCSWAVTDRDIADFVSDVEFPVRTS